MSFDNLTTYIEVDPENTTEVIADRITVTNQERSEDAYIYKDKGVDFYDGDFEFKFYSFLDSSSDDSSNGYLFDVANVIGSAGYLFNNDRTLSLSMIVSTTKCRFQLRELAFGSVLPGADSVLLNLDTQYWHTVERIGGTLTDKIYSDQARTVLIDTLSIAPTSVIKFRYEYPWVGIGIAGLTEKLTGYMGIDLEVDGNGTRKLGRGLYAGLGGGL